MKMIDLEECFVLPFPQCIVAQHLEFVVFRKSQKPFFKRAVEVADESYIQNNYLFFTKKKIRHINFERDCLMLVSCFLQIAEAVAV